MKLLVAFDFDNTIIDDNSDLYVRKLAPDGKIPEEISSLYTNKGWTKYMGAIFKYLHEHKTTEQEILNCMKEIPLVDGMKELLNYLQSDTFDVIIISDSNSVFIDMIMKHADLDTVLQEVYTNPAYFDDAECLHVDFYHTQDWCNLSTVNLCKGHILDTHIEQQKAKGVDYDIVAYVGDGTNDFCPSLRLKRQHDLVFPRSGFSLLKKIEKPDTKEKLSCKVVPWLNGKDILSTIQEAVSSFSS